MAQQSLDNPKADEQLVEQVGAGASSGARDTGATGGEILAALLAAS